MTCSPEAALLQERQIDRSSRRPLMDTLTSTHCQATLKFQLRLATAMPVSLYEDVFEFCTTRLNVALSYSEKTAPRMFNHRNFCKSDRLSARKLLVIVI